MKEKKDETVRFKGLGIELDIVNPSKLSIIIVCIVLIALLVLVGLFKTIPISSILIDLVNGNSP